MARRRPVVNPIVSVPPLELSIVARAGRRYVPFLRSNLRKAHAVLSKRRQAPLRELSVVLVGDRVMSDLHKRFLNIAGPTDVLTFPLDTDRRGRALSGEVVVCVPEAARQAKLRSVPPNMELLLYALHGMLHLSGFDDRTDRDFAVMHRTEDSILKSLGFAPVFHPHPSDSR